MSLHMNKYWMTNFINHCRRCWWFITSRINLILISCVICTPISIKNQGSIASLLSLSQQIKLSKFTSQQLPNLLSHLDPLPGAGERGDVRCDPINRLSAPRLGGPGARFRRWRAQPLRRMRQHCRELALPSVLHRALRA